MIERVQGFVSASASLVDTTPNIDNQTALNILKKRWKHDVDTDMLIFRIDEPKLMIVQGVSRLL